VTIVKGQPWGAPGALPPDGVVVRSDAEGRRVLEEAWRSGAALPTLGLLGGDLWRTLGGAGSDEARLRSGDAVTFPIDVAEVTVDGHAHLFIAHLVARNRCWTRSFVAMNAQWLGRWNLGPRAHPNDGMLDIYEGRLGLDSLWQVRARATLGAHLPHPGIRERRARTAQATLQPPLALWLDGERVGRRPVRDLLVRSQPDAARVVV